MFGREVRAEGGGGEEGEVALGVAAKISSEVGGEEVVDGLAELAGLRCAEVGAGAAHLDHRNGKPGFGRGGGGGGSGRRRGWVRAAQDSGQDQRPETE